MLKCTYEIPTLPPPINLETVPILKALSTANRHLAELKGSALAIPNQGILIDTLALQEAKASSEVENIVTTHNDLFQADLDPLSHHSPNTKEVALYRDALRLGFEYLLETKGLITCRHLVELYQLLKQRSDGFRSTPGTALKNDLTSATIHVPPQDNASIIQHMTALERFINEDESSDLDPLIKMAIIHHQFESIHPFPDGNGRVGRILNVIYLTKSNLLDIPVLYLSGYIVQNKLEYYRLLQAVRDEGAWEEWIIYMLNTVASTAQSTLWLVEGMRGLMARYKREMREKLPKLYSQDLLNNLFRHPYTRIEYVQKDLNLQSRQTAAKYLDQLAANGFVEKVQAGRNNYYINKPLVDLFTAPPDKG
jgi:Fic family protein